jgi:hypothetical protein
MDPKVILVVLLLVGVGAYVWYTQQQQKEEEEPVPAPVPTDSSEPTPSTPTEPAAPSPDATIKIDGLVGWWDGPSYDETSRAWKDKSEKGHDITEITGILKKSKNGEEVQGDIDSVVAFPPELLEDEEEYTFINVAKYNGTHKGRIFTTKPYEGPNLVLGFHAGAGVYYGGDDATINWLTERVDRHGDAFVLSVIQPKLYRSNGALRTAFRNPESEDIGNVPTRIYINGWDNQKSDWSVKEMIVYNRRLTTDEYLAIEKSLIEKYTIKPNRFELSELKGDASSEGWPNLIRDVQFRCGAGEALTGFGVADGPKSKYSCMSGVDLDGDEVSGQTIFEEIQGEAKYFKNLQDKKIDCGESPINAFSLAMDEDEEKIRFEYTCNNSKVKNNTCQTITSDAYATGTSFANMSGLTNARCPAEHVVTAAKLIKEPVDAAKQKWEITCCKPKGI